MEGSNKKPNHRLFTLLHTRLSTMDTPTLKDTLMVGFVSQGDLDSFVLFLDHLVSSPQEDTIRETTMGIIKEHESFLLTKKWKSVSAAEVPSRNKLCMCLYVCLGCFEMG